MKKIISIIIFASMILSSVSVIAQDNISYKLENEVLTISGVGNMRDYDKLTEAPWDKTKNEVKKIVFANGITSIGSWSFDGFDNVKTIEFPQTLKNIGQRAFYNCKSIEFLKFPKGVESLGDGAFNSCINIKSIDLSATVKSIGDSCFMNLGNMSAVTIPSSVNNIGKWAFFGCKSLKHIYFEGDVPQNMGKYMMSDISDDFRIFCNEVYKDKWIDCDGIDENNLYSYNLRTRIPVFLNYKEICFDTWPKIKDGTTLVPMRKIFEEMGAEVIWNEDEESITAKKGDITIKLIIDSEIMYKQNHIISLGHPAILIGNSTYVPVRAVSEAFGAKVIWDNQKRAVNIYMN